MRTRKTSELALISVHFKSHGPSMLTERELLSVFRRHLLSSDCTGMVEWCDVAG